MNACEMIKCPHFRNNACYDDSVYSQLGWCPHNDIWDTYEGAQMLADYETKKNPAD